MTDTAWLEQRGCSDVPLGVFFPDDPQYDEHRARTTCQTCPVVDHCLAYALATRTDYGIYGNTTGDQRRELRRRLGRQLRKRTTT